jgi:hypothetical protein
MQSNTHKTQLVQTIIVFVVLFIVGVGITVGARAMANQIEQQILMHAGSAIVSGGLAFFLVEMFRWRRAN